MFLKEELLLNYESEVEGLLREQFIDYYGTKDNWFEFLICKYIIHYDKKVKKPDNYELIKFILDELKINHKDNSLNYKGTILPFYEQLNQSIGNILVNFYLSENVDFDTMKKNISNGKTYARKAVIVPKSHTYFNLYKKSFLMQYIKNVYDVSYSNLKELSGFEYDSLFESRSIEECYEWYLNDYEKEKQPYLLTESLLENYLFKNISILGDNLKPIDKQTIIGQNEEGRLDIWARDNESKNILIECKIVSNPKDLLWQCINYPSFFKEKYNQDISKIIVVSPQMKDSLKDRIVKAIELPIEFIHFTTSFDFEKKEFNFHFSKKD